MWVKVGEHLITGLFHQDLGHGQGNSLSLKSLSFQLRYYQSHGAEVMVPWAGNSLGPWRTWLPSFQASLVSARTAALTQQKC